MKEAFVLSARRGLAVLSQSSTTRKVKCEDGSQFSAFALFSFSHIFYLAALHEFGLKTTATKNGMRSD